MLPKQIEHRKRDKENILRLANSDFRTLGKRFIQAAIAAYQEYGNPLMPLNKFLEEVVSALMDMSLAGHLHGRFRVFKSINEIRQRSLAQPYDNAVNYMKKRMELSEEQLRKIRSQYSDVAINVGRSGINAVEIQLKRASDEIISQGMHVKEAAKVIQEAFEFSGFGPVNPWLATTLARTQIQLSYSAGRWNILQDPIVNQAIWGYRYVTVGDARVREEHAALDNVTYPKDDPIWNRIWTPNGFNCRCDILDIFIDEKDEQVVQEVPEPYENENGKVIVPGPDKDWDVNPGLVYQDFIRAA